MFDILLQVVSIAVNGTEVEGVRMKLGHAGEAYFVQDVPEDGVTPDLETSPITTPISSPDISPDTTPEPQGEGFHLDSPLSSDSETEAVSPRSESIGSDAGDGFDDNSETLASPNDEGTGQEEPSPRTKKKKSWAWGWGQLPVRKRMDPALNTEVLEGD